MQRHGGSPLIRQARWREGGAGADGAVCSRGQSGGRPGLRTENVGEACRHVARRQVPRPWAPTLCLVRGVYTTCVHTMFRLVDSGAPGKAVYGRRFAGILPIPFRPCAGDLGKQPGRGRPILVGVFHEFLTGRNCAMSMPGECAPGHVQQSSGRPGRAGTLSIARAGHHCT